MKPIWQKLLLELIETDSGLRLNTQQNQVLTGAFTDLAEDQNINPDDLVLAFQAGEKLELLQALEAKFTISETHFYRISPQIQALKNTILPELIAARAAQKRLRLWSAGCSTGEEVYTLLMLLEEHGGLEDWDIRALGTDLNPAVLKLARLATYSAWSFRDTPPEVIERFFRVSGKHFRVRNSVRRRADFQVLNLLQNFELPETSFELILCRNVTIYFAPKTAQAVYEKLAAKVVPGGWLVLGPSDPPMAQATVERCGLEMILQPGAILWRKSAGLAKLESKTTIQKPVVQTFKKPEMPTTIQKPVLQKSVARVLNLPPTPKVKTPNEVVNIKLELWQEHLQNGLEALELADFSEALLHLRRAVFLEPSEALAQFALARAFMGVHQTSRALVVLHQARRLLAALEPSTLIWGADEMTANDLLHTVNSMLEQQKTLEVKA